MNNTKLEVCKKCWGTGQVHGGEENSTWSKTCEECHGIGFVRVPKTRADRIRAMTDEELAKLLYEIDGLGYCKNLPECGELLDAPGGIPEEKCIGCMLQWLRQTAEEDAHDG